MDVVVLFQFLLNFLFQYALANAMYESDLFHFILESMVHTETEIMHLNFECLMSRQIARVLREHVDMEVDLSLAR